MKSFWLLIILSKSIILSPLKYMYRLQYFGLQRLVLKWRQRSLLVLGTRTWDPPEGLWAIELSTVGGGEEAIDVLQAQVLQVSEQAAQVPARRHNAHKQGQWTHLIQMGGGKR